MIKLHIALWEFLFVGVALSLVGVFAVRARELKDRLPRRRRDTGGDDRRFGSIAGSVP